MVIGILTTGWRAGGAIMGGGREVPGKTGLRGMRKSLVEKQHIRLQIEDLFWVMVMIVLVVIREHGMGEGGIMWVLTM